MLISAYHLYILTNQRNGTLYVGVTNNLVRRVYEHRKGVVPGFTKEHGLKRLVYFEEHATAESMIQREKRVKRWRREWKLRMIEEMNPQWRDLWEEITR